jgi:hypothetical protein
MSRSWCLNVKKVRNYGTIAIAQTYLGKYLLVLFGLR